jgi:hypothetical protein
MRIWSFIQCEYCEIRNVSMFFSKSLVFDSWFDKIFWRLWFGKTHTHISSSQYSLIAVNFEPLLWVWWHESYDKANYVWFLSIMNQSFVLRKNIIKPLCMNLNISLSHRFDFESATVFEQPTAGSCDGDAIINSWQLKQIWKLFIYISSVLTRPHQKSSLKWMYRFLFTNFVYNWFFFIT